jgi:hypothetical protein
MADVKMPSGVKLPLCGLQARGIGGQMPKRLGRAREAPEHWDNRREAQPKPEPATNLAPIVYEYCRCL